MAMESLPPKALDLQEMVAHSVRMTRKLRGLTQEHVASAIKVNYRHYQSIEAGKVDLRLSTVAKLISYLRIAPCALLSARSRMEFTVRGDLPCLNFVSSAPFSMAVIDLKGLILFVNRRLSELLNRSALDLNCKIPFIDLMANPQDGERFLKVLSETSDPNKINAFEAEFLTKDKSPTKLRLEFESVTSGEGTFYIVGLTPARH